MHLDETQMPQAPGLPPVSVAVPGAAGVRWLRCQAAETEATLRVRGAAAVVVVLRRTQTTRTSL